MLHPAAFQLPIPFEARTQSYGRSTQPVSALNSGLIGNIILHAVNYGMLATMLQGIAERLLVGVTALMHTWSAACRQNRPVWSEVNMAPLRHGSKLQRGMA